MPIYSWECADCKGATDVMRNSSDIDKVPELCEHCPSTQFTHRLIARPTGCKGFILVDSGYGWPSHGFYSQRYDPKDGK